MKLSSKIALFSLPLICAGTQAMIYLPKGLKMPAVQKYAATKKFIIGYDIHDVLAKRDKVGRVKSIIKYLPPLAMSRITDKKVWTEFNQVKKDNGSGQAYEQLFLKHGYSSLAKMARETANAFKPRKGMPSIIDEMKQRGHTQRFASNIGETFLQNLNTKFKTKYQNHLLDKIEPGKVVDFSHYGKNPLPKPLPKHLASKPKPDPIFFQEFIDAWNPGLEELMIHIDDKLDNVKSAVSKGFIGIHVNPKLKDEEFVKQLRTAFQSLGLYGKKINRFN